MSLCTFSDNSDVYIRGENNDLVCSSCLLVFSALIKNPKKRYTKKEMIAHLKEHQKFGDLVPQEVFNKLK